MKALQSNRIRKLKKDHPEAFQEWVSGKSDTLKIGDRKLRVVPVRGNQKKD
ncbi:MAG: hypothetical protein ABW068_10235 [Candidatus Thiodiazotropha sp.]